MTTSKRSRTSLACVRCRKRNVKCDFTHPQCNRCSVSDLSCIYADDSPRVDNHAFDRLGIQVHELTERMKIMQTELIKITAPVPQARHTALDTAWKLRLTPGGIRIDTNVSNVEDLHRALLNAVSQLEINNKTCLYIPGIYDSNSSSAETFSWQSKQQCTRQMQGNPQGLQSLAHICYQSCFLPFQIADQQKLLQVCHNPQGPQELLLVHSICAWVAKHSSIYHPYLCLNDASAAAGEAYFLEAKQLLRRCFINSNATTIHALLNLYMYQLSCERTTLAYLHIGLAIRMAQDLGLHKKEHMPIDLKQREINRRLWWSVYWLDLCAALESNRPTMVDDKDCDVEYPIPLQDEDPETGYRIAFGVESIKLMKIRKVIAKQLPSERIKGSCLLDAISHLETSLTKWLNELPVYFSSSANNSEKTALFCEEACVILNIQYFTTWIMLHRLVLNEQEAAASPVALLSLDVCIKAAHQITQLLQTYAKQIHWCHFYYCLDGIVESVYIHQKSFICNQLDATIKQAAVNHLVNTVRILYEIPLSYMQRVRNILDQIKEFLGQQDQEIPQEPLKTNNVPQIVMLKSPNVSMMDLIQQPTYSNEELNQMLSIYNND
ncbi:hypothetical protein [Parasitella parasitica]|uniref:Zn(2)-C6 fungal-type domain-containing protein n=1 Tax=Parasitella parasitica TaxID=35722 RepID=A0A0B7NLE9_9FUNG|nr:hypothetical protein [Parasitella parasitica]